LVGRESDPDVFFSFSRMPKHVKTHIKGNALCFRED